MNLVKPVTAVVLLSLASAPAFAGSLTHTFATDNTADRSGW